MEINVTENMLALVDQISHETLLKIFFSRNIFEKYWSKILP